MENEVQKKKPIVLSGVQPSGFVTLGNYLGAFKNWNALQDENDCIYMIANLHAITVRQDPVALKKNTLDGLALVLACGVDPAKSDIFIQSHNPHHAELSWILSCYAQFGELSRMTQFKDKSAKYADNINGGLFTYPVLMTADILLYQAQFVPVGIDQKQHVELARTIANRFNGIYGDVFTMPDCILPKQGAKIMSLTDPTKKMSKSDPNPKSYVAVLDERNTIIKKFKSAVTDSGSGIYRAEDKLGISNLMTIYSAVTGKNDEEIMREFENAGYGDFKLAVGETVADTLSPIKARFDEIIADKAYLKEVYTEGAKKAMKRSIKTLSKVYKKVGFGI